MTANTSRKPSIDDYGSYTSCPMCGKTLVAIRTSTGKLYPHKDPATGDQCEQREMAR